MIKIELKKLLDGHTLYWLSVQSGVRWSTLAAMAKGRARRIDLEVLDAICDALGCQPGDFLIRVERRKARKRGK